MNRKNYLPYLVLPVALMLMMSGCQREEVSPPKVSGEVRATARYLEYFGDPPTVAEGTCYALVGFYPSARETGKVSPFPLFLFNQEQQLEIVTEQLLRWGEGWDMGGMLLNPFPPETELIALQQEEDMVRVELSDQAWDGTDAGQKKTILDVVGHTLAQFEGVSRVMLVAAGKLFPYQAERAFVPDPSVLAPPGPPQVLAVAATWQAGNAVPEDLSVFFDRPVTVQTFELADDGGRRIEGEYYRSAFDMAVVVHPADPAAIVEGMPVQVSWQVTDGLGREGEGHRSLFLTRLEHP